LLVVLLISWGIAFFEYCFMIPANRLGHSAGMSLANNASLAVDEECYFSKVHKEDRERVRAAYRNLIEGHTEKVCEEFRVVSNESGHWSRHRPRSKPATAMAGRCRWSGHRS
jgi:hypothetical protein